nr:uracil-DNA glycosylase family protein [Hymenobacter cyanobacteriorum]
MPTVATRLPLFLANFPAPPALPPGIEAQNPFQEPAVQTLAQRFADKFYAANQSRVALLGINPGRLGMGRTGVAFTDPVALRDICGIANDLPRGRPELSTQFVYRVVEALGGPAEFYRHFFLSSIYPLVLLNKGLNYNYYDSPAVIKALWPDLQRSLRQQVADFGLRRDVAVSLGRRNGKFLTKLNKELGLFDKIVVLDHPRYLMQYRRRDLEANVAKYVETLGSLLAH